MATPQPLIRLPVQRRSQESLERVLDAGFKVLQERGLDGFTLQEVSQRAGVSIGSIYGRVPGKEALIMAIYERETAWTEAAGRFARAVLKLREDLRHPEPELAVDLAYRMVYYTIARRITHGPKFESS